MTRAHSIRRVGCIAFITAILGAACTDDSDVALEQIQSTHHDLYLLGNPWPEGKVNVCVDRNDRPDLLAKARTILANSWSQAANISFVGWGSCHPLPKAPFCSAVRVSFAANTNGLTSPIGRRITTGCVSSTEFPALTDVSLISNDSDPFEQYFRYEVVHEFGHALAFAHEQERPDNFPPGGPPICPQFDSILGSAQPRPGGEVETAFDFNSVMNYCANETLAGGSFVTLLSSGDIQGVRKVYGRNPAAHGFLIQSDTNSSLGVNAAGATEGTIVTLRSGCTSGNPECTWSYQYGMLVSDSDPTLAVNAFGGAQEGTVLRMTRQCGSAPRNSQNPDCTWTYRQGQFLSDRDPTLAINAGGGAQPGTTLVLTRACIAQNPDCTWTLPHVMLSSARNSSLAVNAFGGASNLTALKLHDGCSVANPDCTWKFSRGMISSDRNTSLSINAFNGAANLAQVVLHNECVPRNSDCTWTWSRGQLISDNPASGTLPINALGGAVFSAPLKLNRECSEGNPDCVFSAFFARN